MPNTINLNVGTGQTRTVTFNCGSTYVLDDIVFIISGEDSDSDTSLELLEEVTYAQLKNLRDTDALVPGKFYRMTDFVTTTSTLTSALPAVGFKYKSAMHPFDLVLLAVSKNELDHRAIAILSDDDNSDYFKNCDLLKWQIWYDIENNTNRYGWAWNDDTGAGKGVIYRMIDEHGNDCPYDFKNILFVRSTDAVCSGVDKTTSGTLNWVYTFCEEGFKDISVSNSMSAARNNVILKYDISLNDIVMIGRQFEGNSFGYGCREISFSQKTNNNNKFGNNCFGINLTNSSSNTFGDDCSGIDMKVGCYGNTFGNSCTEIYIGEYCQYNVFGDKCASICFGDEDKRYGDYVENVIIRNNVNGVNLYRSGGDTLNKLQNIYIAQGVNNTKVTSITRNNIYRTTVAMLTDGTVRIYKEDEEAIHYIVGNTLCIGGYPPNYLRFEITDSTSDTNFLLKTTMDDAPVIYYSVDDCSSWTVMPYNSEISIPYGGIIYFKGYNGNLSDYANNKSTRLTVYDGSCSMLGSVQSLVDGVGWSPQAVEMYGLFSESTAIEKVERNILPATSLVESCYLGMFENCPRLRNTPDLPAKNVESYCYQSMFAGCISLRDVMSELPALRMREYCYARMFQGCSCITAGPKLPADVLDKCCYGHMFGDSAIEKAPELNAEILEKECYYYMFSGCTNLISILCLATDISATNCTTNWVKGVASSGTFTKESTTTWTTGYNGIPQGWTVYNI